MLTVQCKVHFQVGRKSRKRMGIGHEELPPGTPVEAGRIPRVARLMALAIRLERLLAEGVARDYADLARLGGVTRARLTQIMNLTLLAPDIQEELVHLPRVTSGRDPVAEPQLRAIAAVSDWRKQRKLWRALLTETAISTG
jgi:hypothetical protein